MPDFTRPTGVPNDATGWFDSDNSIAVLTSGIMPATNNSIDLGSLDNQWRNIYTADLNLNNTNSRDNDIDGTRGYWTIQEGADDLFLLNRLNGKKYKFKLEEI